MMISSEMSKWISMSENFMVLGIAGVSLGITLGLIATALVYGGPALFGVMRAQVPIELFLGFVVALFLVRTPIGFGILVLTEWLLYEIVSAAVIAHQAAVNHTIVGGGGALGYFADLITLAIGPGIAFALIWFRRK